MKSRHYFDPAKGVPPYWLRRDPADMVEHRRMVEKHEAVHRRRPPKKDVPR